MEGREDVRRIRLPAQCQCLGGVEAGAALDVGGVAAEAPAGVARWLTHPIIAAGLRYPVQVDITEAGVIGRAEVCGVEDEYGVIRVLLHHRLQVGITQPDCEGAGLRGGRGGKEGSRNADVKAHVGDGVQTGGLGGVGRVLCPPLRVEATRAGKGLLRGDHGVEGTERSELVALAGDSVGVGHEGRRISVRLVLTAIARELARTVRHALGQLGGCQGSVDGHALASQEKGQRARTLAC